SLLAKAVIQAGRFREQARSHAFGQNQKRNERCVGERLSCRILLAKAVIHTGRFREQARSHGLRPESKADACILMSAGA
ncbi:hypothetical protein CVE27_18850, partial [Pseudomonas syringae pv. actinidiae]|nr:hypothetical protein [Pseudomonas syringae pv. actinidiae]